MTLSPRTIARSILRWDWLSCVSSAARRTRFMWGSNPSRIPRYPRPPFSSTITFELIRWLRRESGLIIGPRRSHGGGVLKGLREGRRCESTGCVLVTEHETPLREAPSTLEHEPQRRDCCEDDQESDRAEGKEKRILPDGRLLRGPPEREVSGTPRGLGHEGHEVGCRPGEVERLRESRRQDGVQPENHFLVVHENVHTWNGRAQ